MTFFQKGKLQVACNDLFDTIFLLIFSLFGSVVTLNRNLLFGANNQLG